MITFKQYCAEREWERLNNQVVRVETSMDDDGVVTCDFYVKDPLFGDMDDEGVVTGD